MFRDQRKTPQASWVGRNVLILVFASLSLVKINLVWLRLLVGYIGTMPQIIQLITGTLRPNEFLTKGSPLDMLLLPLVMTEKLARPTQHVPPTYSGGNWVAGTPGTAGAPRKYSYVEVIDCQDLTHATYRQGRLRGNWSKYVGDEAQYARNRCSDRANFKVKTMKL